MVRGLRDGLPAFSSTFSQVELSAIACALLVKADGTNAVSSFTTPTGAWTTSSLTGLGSGERLSSLLTYGGKLYATTSGSRLYEASTLGTAFTAKTFPTTATPQTLLGGLSVDGKPTLALVGKTAAGATTFLGYNISAGTISTIGETPSSSFPTAGSTLSYELTGSSYDGAALYVSGGRTADGKASPNLWATTNGTAWLIVGGKAQAGISAVSQRSGLCRVAEAYLSLRLDGIDAGALHLG